MSGDTFEERIASIRKAISEDSSPRIDHLLDDRAKSGQGIVVQGNRNFLTLVYNASPEIRLTDGFHKRGRSFAGVDWRRAPSQARWWAMDASGNAHWFCTPGVAAFSDRWFSEPLSAPDFGFCGDWRESLTERPSL